MSPKKNKKSTQTSTKKTSTIEFIEKEITLDKNYSINLKKLEDELVKDEYIDPLTVLNFEGFIGIINKEERDKNIKILKELDEVLELSKFNINKQRFLLLKINKNQFCFDKLSIEELKKYQNLVKNGYDNFLKVIKSEKFDIFNAIKEKIVDPKDKVLLKKIKEEVINEIDSNIEKKENKSNDLRLVIDLKSFYVQGFINKDNNYFYYHQAIKSKGRILTETNKFLVKEENKKYEIINEEFWNKGIKKCFPLGLTVPYPNEDLHLKISKMYLNKAIKNLKNIENKENIGFNSENKKDLIALVFATSEAIRFKMNSAFFIENKSIDEKIKTLINIQEEIQNCIEYETKFFDWKISKDQLRDWENISKEFNKSRKEIFENLNLSLEYFKIQNKVISKIKNENKIFYWNKEDYEKIWGKFEKNLKNNSEAKKEILKKFFMRNFYFIFKISERKTLFQGCHYNQKIENRDWNYLEKIPLLQTIILNNNLDMVKLLIWKNKNLLTEESEIENNILHCACVLNFDEKYQEQIPEFIRNKNLNYENEEQKQINLINFLLDNGAKEIINKPNKKGNTALHTSVFSSNIKTAKLLIEHGIDINIKNEDGDVAAHIAVQNNNTSLIELLIKDKNFKIELENNNQEGFLFLSGFNSNINATELIINKAKEVYKEKESFIQFINKQNKNQSTLLHMASHNDKKDLVKLLIDNGVDVNIQDKNGDTALHHAVCQNQNCLKNNLDVVKELLNNPNSKDKINVSIPNKDGYTALDIIEIKLIEKKEKKTEKWLEISLKSDNLKNYLNNKFLNYLIKEKVIKEPTEKEKKGIFYFVNLQKYQLFIKNINIIFWTNDNINHLNDFNELIKIAKQKDEEKDKKIQSIKDLLELKSKIQITEKLLEDKSKLIQKQILDLNNKLNFYKKELENKLISSTTFSEQEKKTNEPLKSLKEEISSLKIEEINEEQTKKMRAITKRSKINSIDLQNQPSTSGYKPKAPQM